MALMRVNSCLHYRDTHHSEITLGEYAHRAGEFRCYQREAKRPARGADVATLREQLTSKEQALIDHLLSEPRLRRGDRPGENHE
jgi:hypothetical protein